MKINIKKIIKNNIIEIFFKIWKSLLENLNYWNVEKQEAYFSYVESSIEREKEDN